MIGKDAICSCRSWFPALSIRLDAVIQASHWTEVNNRDNELCVSAVVVDAAKQQSYQFNALEESIGKASEQHSTSTKLTGDRLISYYEKKEVTSIFELALWKANLDHAGGNIENCNEYSIEVPGPVQDTILGYLSEQFNN